MIWTGQSTGAFSSTPGDPCSLLPYSSSPGPVWPRDQYLCVIWFIWPWERDTEQTLMWHRSPLCMLCSLTLCDWYSYMLTLAKMDQKSSAARSRARRPGLQVQCFKCAFLYCRELALIFPKVRNSPKSSDSRFLCYGKFQNKAITKKFGNAPFQFSLIIRLVTSDQTSWINEVDKPFNKIIKIY